MRRIGILSSWKEYIYNLIGLQPSGNPSNEYVIISAHMDHLGTNPGAGPDYKVFNGANDNASGMTVLLQIAKAFQNKALEKNVLFILFTAEEMGLKGSFHTANWMLAKDLNIPYVLNIDMVGTRIKARSNQIFLTGIDYSNLGSLFNNLMGYELLIKDEIEIGTRGFYRADSYSFYDKLKVPSHTFSTFNDFNYRQYHSALDDADVLDYLFINEIIARLTFGFEALINSNTEIKLYD